MSIITHTNIQWSYLPPSFNTITIVIVINITNTYTSSSTTSQYTVHITVIRSGHNNNIITKYQYHSIIIITAVTIILTMATLHELLRLLACFHIISHGQGLRQCHSLAIRTSPVTLGVTAVTSCRHGPRFPAGWLPAMSLLHQAIAISHWLSIIYHQSLLAVTVK